MCIRDRKLTVRIPPGIASGQRLRLYGEGEAGQSGGPPGDLYVVVNVQEHPVFRRELTVRIPPGIASGQRLRLYGEGEAGQAGGPSGDLYVVVQVQEHPVFRREGDDLFCRVPVTFPIVALGGDLSVPTLGGPEKVAIPEGTKSGQVFRLRGKGMPSVSGRG